jgi:hypothetical protein
LDSGACQPKIQNPQRPDEAPLSFELDDGSMEAGRGFGSGIGNFSDSAIWLNRFTPPSASYPITIESVKIFWPMQTTLGVNDTLIGKHTRLLVYGDPDGDGNPDNATLLFQQVVTVTTHNTFQSYPVSLSVPGPGGDVYIGFEDLWAERAYNPMLYGAAFDNNSPSQVRSWLAAHWARKTPGNKDGTTRNRSTSGQEVPMNCPHCSSAKTSQLAE